MNSPLSCRCGVWLLCLGLLLPGLSRAAQAAPGETTWEEPGTQARAPRWLLADAPEPEARRAPTAVFRGLRILGEVGGGLLTAGALGVVGGLGNRFLCATFNPARDVAFDDLRCVGSAFLGFSAGLIVGAPLGVWGTGELLGGNGSLLTSVVGAALGYLGGYLVTTVAGNALIHSSSRSGLPNLLLPATTLVGGILGYELSQRPKRRWAARGGLQPLLSITPNAAVMGLGGRF